MVKLLDRITYKITEKGCWECTSHRAERCDYPRFSINGKSVSGHRQVYTEEKGPIPEGLLVRHTCDNRRCLNPDHLLLGTHKDNFEDMKERRGVKHLIVPPEKRARGSQIKTSKLTEKQVLEIKNLLHLGKGVTEIAKMYNKTHQTISDINTGKHWGWLK